MDENVEKGRKIVLVAMAIVIGVSLLTIAINQVSGAHQSLLVQFIRFILSCIMCYLVYNGSNVAKWVCIVLLSIASVLGLLGTLAIFISPLLGLASLFYFATYLTTVLLLLVPKSVRSYFEAQKLSR